MASKKFTPPRKSNKTTIDIAELEAEKRRLYVDGSDNKRLKWIIAKLDEFYFGIIIKK